MLTIYDIDIPLPKARNSVRTWFQENSSVKDPRVMWVRYCHWSGCSFLPSSSHHGESIQSYPWNYQSRAHFCAPFLYGLIIISDMLIEKGYMNLEETLLQYKQRSHLIRKIIFYSFVACMLWFNQIFLLIFSFSCFCFLCSQTTMLTIQFN